MATFKDFEHAVALLSGGGNTVIYDDVGLPSIMVKIDKKQIQDLIDGGSGSTHQAFMVDGVEIPAFYYSKYQNIVYRGRAYSLPLQDPAASSVNSLDRGDAPSTGVTFDNSKIWSEKKGPGWHLATNAEWAAIALWCRKHGLMPRGNNNYGKDHGAAFEEGLASMPLDGSNRIQRVATGSGPASWSHDGTPGGIWDLNGNVWEWIGGYRTVAGEIQIIPDNNAAKQILQTPESTLWKAIMPNGSLVDPGTSGTLKLDYVGSNFVISTSLTSQGDSSRNGTFHTMGAEAGLIVPEVLKALALFPADSGNHGLDRFYANNGAAERLACRGGDWVGTSNAGVFSLVGRDSRSVANSYIGFRSAYIPRI